MIDHLGLRVSEYAESKRFFESALAPLGYQVVMEFGGSVAGLGAAGKPDFWISQGEAAGAVHVAFASPDRATVDAFHQAALAAGGGTMGLPVSAPSTIRTTTGLSCSIRTETTSRLCVTSRVKLTRYVEEADR